MPQPNPCITCGACCAYFRASFHWTETDEYILGTVPIELTEELNEHLRVMKGTNQKNPRCIALEGQIGESVQCNIYPKRSNVCQEFMPSWANGEYNERCDKARAVWGMAPLTPEFWQNPDNHPELPRAA
jgi:Fe-S-cluster containining protein